MNNSTTKFLQQSIISEAIRLGEQSCNSMLNAHTRYNVYNTAELGDEYGISLDLNLTTTC